MKNLELLKCLYCHIIGSDSIVGLESCDDFISFVRKNLDIKIHRKKIKYKYAKLFVQGVKDWEVRENDCNYKIGDIVEFTVNETGSKYITRILYVFEGGGFGVDKGTCIFSHESIKTL